MTLYEEDFYKWTQEQANLLTENKLTEIDINNITLEIINIGNMEYTKLNLYTTILLEYLLKWRYKFNSDYKEKWISVIVDQRSQLQQLIEHSPSLKVHSEHMVESVYPTSVIRATKATNSNEEDFPVTCPWTLNEVLSYDFYPE